ncbi:hypothetical protein R3P38DRAFT_3214371 [Favolaschia claudopus]|uniref:Uncharacterized protein n=1 Tax=Favolaschia claudopus TaxID=2862362 RepID=A0AAW0ACD7_9AGAR
MSADWPDRLYISTCSLRSAKIVELTRAFSCSVVLLRVCRGCSNDGVLPRPDTVAGSSRYVNPKSPAPLASIETDANQSIGSAGLSEMLSVHPSSRRTSASTLCRPAPPPSTRTSGHCPHHPGLIDLEPCLPSSPPTPPPSPRLHPHLYFTSASPRSSALSSHPHGASAYRLALVSFRLARYLAHLPPPLRHFCISTTTLEKRFLWAGVCDTAPDPVSLPREDDRDDMPTSLQEEGGRRWGRGRYME